MSCQFFINKAGSELIARTIFGLSGYSHNKGASWGTISTSRRNGTVQFFFRIKQFQQPFLEYQKTLSGSMRNVEVVLGDRSLAIEITDKVIVPDSSWFPSALLLNASLLQVYYTKTNEDNHIFVLIEGSHETELCGVKGKPSAWFCVKNQGARIPSNGRPIPYKPLHTTV